MYLHLGKLPQAMNSPFLLKRTTKSPLSSGHFSPVFLGSILLTLAFSNAYSTLGENLFQNLFKNLGNLLLLKQFD